jgi:DnaJ-class molecular chaperone
MPAIDCPNCGGTGYEEDATGETIICTMCDGTGVVFVDEGAGVVEDERWAGSS